ncbi:hypothetical protein CPB86DRAFT_79541 [Serendipita vermifera]|nr:hypothetical protein CPB86DRAFT_79541 [Serendipita vermifera]
MTDSHSIQYSTEFPSEYGDFELQSSDGIAFSFPRGILGHISPVFKDMFSIGISNDSNSQQPLLLTEDSKTITEFLIYIDPLKDHPGFSINSVMPLLEAATKYQVPKIIDSFKKWAIKNASNLNFPCRKYPILFISLAEKLNLPELGGVYMSYAAKGNKSCLSFLDYPLSVITIIQIMEVRAERTQILVEKLVKFIRAQIDKLGTKEIPGLVRASERSKYADVKRSSPCPRCTNRLHDLIVKTVICLQKEPSWSAFVYETERLHVRCGHCRSNPWDDMQELTESDLTEEGEGHSAFETLKAEIQAIEMQPILLKSLIA